MPPHAELKRTIRNSFPPVQLSQFLDKNTSHHQGQLLTQAGVAHPCPEWRKLVPVERVMKKSIRIKRIGIIEY